MSPPPPQRPPRLCYTAAPPPTCGGACRREMPRMPPRLPAPPPARPGTACTRWSRAGSRSPRRRPCRRPAGRGAGPGVRASKELLRCGVGRSWCRVATCRAIQRLRNAATRRRPPPPTAGDQAPEGGPPDGWGRAVLLRLLRLLQRLHAPVGQGNPSGSVREGQHGALRARYPILPSLRRAPHLYTHAYLLRHRQLRLEILHLGLVLGQAALRQIHRVAGMQSWAVMGPALGPSLPGMRHTVAAATPLETPPLRPSTTHLCRRACAACRPPFLGTAAQNSAAAARWSASRSSTASSAPPTASPKHVL